MLMIMMQKINTLLDMLGTLDEGITLYDEYAELFKACHSPRSEQLYRGMRDSMIQRFEYCIDMFWKVMKLYLEEKEKIEIAINSPRGILREAVKARIISEEEAEIGMHMVESRNKTSHIYHESMAETIASHIPEYYELMKCIVDHLRKLIMNEL
jgi:nucleotidyltransferase substrate binding protein (TIGR01987 family)